MRQHGLYVSQRNRRGVAWLETEIPYEELLPVGLEYAAPGPLRAPSLGSWVGIWVVLQVLVQLLKTQPQLSEELVWVGAIGFVLGLSAVYLVRRYLQRTVTLGTNRIRITLRDQKNQRAALEAFTEELRQRAHGYLREEYAQINPLGPIELQLHRLKWLHHLEVLSAAELKSLSTRLTGRLSLDPLTLMGQELETPYVN
ncbi:hypothetical protein DNI29_20100 [Hymenobacter sediminis]|uniref:hypothetical protein n=1 Tax=Hymenobacter sediminis TaxID=2218621 RepID=UPI000DA64F56|nr:hypothetical protein [Hymenobacter sediminis]RPD44997.1 hypothetical protein DNI29_20100 [Hymenobacter sediminis]